MHNHAIKNTELMVNVKLKAKPSKASLWTHYKEKARTSQK